MQIQARGLHRPSVYLPGAGLCVISRGPPSSDLPVVPQVLGHPTLPWAQGGTVLGSRAL